MDLRPSLFVVDISATVATNSHPLSTFHPPLRRKLTQPAHDQFARTQSEPSTLTVLRYPEPELRCGCHKRHISKNSSGSPEIIPPANLALSLVQTPANAESVYSGYIKALILKLLTSVLYSSSWGNIDFESFGHCRLNCRCSAFAYVCKQSADSDSSFRCASLQTQCTES